MLLKGSIFFIAIPQNITGIKNNTRIIGRRTLSHEHTFCHTGIKNNTHVIADAPFNLSKTRPHITGIKNTTHTNLVTRSVLTLYFLPHGY